MEEIFINFSQSGLFISNISYFCTPMRINRLVLLLFMAISMLSCKNEFERIRAGGNPDMIYEYGFKLYEKGEYLKAQTLFEQILSSYRGREQAEKLYFSYAYTHYHLRSYLSAAFYFKNFAQTFSTSSLREEAEFMSAFSNYKLSPGYKLDQTYTLKAIEDFQNFINLYPNSPKVAQSNAYIDELRVKLEQKAYSEGQLYFDLRQYQSATQSFENLLRDYPETKNAEMVRFQILNSAYLLAENSIYEKQKDRYQEVLVKYEVFKSKYPRSKMLKEATAIRNKSNEKLKEFSNVRYQN